MNQIEYLTTDDIDFLQEYELRFMSFDDPKQEDSEGNLIMTLQGPELSLHTLTFSKKEIEEFQGLIREFLQKKVAEYMSDKPKKRSFRFLSED